MSRLTIAYAINDAYTKPLMAVWIALFQHKHPNSHYVLYVLNYQLSEENRKALNEHLAQLDCKAELHFLDISDEDAKRIPVVNGWHPSASYRLLLPKLLPDEDRILYLDTDTVVLADLTHLEQLPLDNYALAGTNSFILNGQHKIEKLCLIKQHNHHDELYHFSYVNSGVIYMNLAYWREHNWVEKTLAILHQMKEIDSNFSPDQEAINYLLSTSVTNVLLSLPYSYNLSAFLESLSIFSPEIKSIKTPLPQVNIPDCPQRYIRDLWIEDKHKNILKSEQLQILHMIKSSPWVAHHSDQFVEFFQPYADAVGLELPDRFVEQEKPKTNPLKKAIKMLLPYGVIRYIQIQKKKRG